MVGRKQFPDIPGSAVIFVDRGSEEIYYCNEAARSMLGQSAGTLPGRTLWDAIGVPRDSGLPLVRTVRAGRRTALPPTLLRPAAVGEMVVGGYLFSQWDAGRDALVLLLFPLSSGDQSCFATNLAPADVVAVLGVDMAGLDDRPSPADFTRLMIDIRFGLQQIVPERDDVGLPVGASIPIALRDVTIEQGKDISRALLSHLTPLLANKARIRIGLAQCKRGESPLATLVAANNALLQLQWVGSGDFISVAPEGADDSSGLNGAGGEGVFAEPDSSVEAANYLAALTALTPDPQHAGTYLDQVVALTLGQPRVSAVAVYRRGFDDNYELVAGGMNTPAGVAVAGEKQLPPAIRQSARRQKTDKLRLEDRIDYVKTSIAVLPLKLYERVLGFMVIRYDQQVDRLGSAAPGIAALHYLASGLATLPDWRQSGGQAARPAAPAVDERIDGYVGDNMEGAIDQAVFLSRLDVPVAVIGPRGTGKLYVAKVIHQEAGGAPEMLVAIDCREFRSRRDALQRIGRELERSRGKTLVFKSPHLMNPDAQLKLARQISSRILADTSPPRYLPAGRIIALFPDSLEHLVSHGGLNEKLASVFSAYPIRVPPIRDRKRAVLRWAHKILVQEGARRDRKVSGFTPDAQEAMLQHDWPGNISEMRQCIINALDKTDKEWLTPVDLGIFKGLSPSGRPGLPEKRAFLQALVEEPGEEDAYTPSTLDEVGVALGEALHSMLELEMIKPLGAWLDDEVILAVCERYRENMRAAADFLQTRPRNIGRWMPKILARDHERSSSSLWQTPQRLVRQWLREAAPMAEPPQQIAQELLLSHILAQCEAVSVADRARILGVSTPTYQKRLQEIRGRSPGINN